MEKYGFDLYSLENSTNEDIIIKYTPDFSVIKYSYTIIKDDVRQETINVNNNEKSNIVLTETGNYQIEVVVQDRYYGQKIISSGQYIIDKEAPTINIKNNSIELKIGDSFDIMKGIKATDNKDGNITNFITTNKKQLDFNSEGNKELIYKVSDTAGNTTTQIVNVKIVKSYDNYLFTVQGIIGCLVLLFILLIINFINSIKKEKRLTDYSITPLIDNSKSLTENINKNYRKIVNKLSIALSKSELIKRYSNRYLKYSEIFQNDNKDPIFFVSRKIIVGLLFILIAIIVATFRLEVLLIQNMIIPFVVGFFALDIIYIYKYHVYKKNIENDLLQAIIIMNNAFKSGRSITQAVDLVANELEGPISVEFKKISMELSFGLEIEVAFRRFSERINIEEANYLTSSLSILSKTGGNIIKVFSSIEKTLFNRKKLRLELKSLTGSSKLIMYALILVPICFTLLVNVINPNYFAPLFSSAIGAIIVVIILVLYITYIFIITKVIKIKV